MRRALILSGGGARGAFQVGMLEELIVNQKLDFQILRGVSVGALNAAFLAQAPSRENSQEALIEQVKQLKNLWVTEISGNQSIYTNRSGFLGLAFGADSVYSVKPLKAIINKHISVEHLVNSGRDFAVGTTSLVSGKYNECSVKNYQDDFLDRILASASIPVVFPFVDIKDKDVLVDGGVRNITPLRTVFKVIPLPDEIYILLASRFDPDITNIPDSTTEEYEYKQWQDNWLGTKINGIDVLKRSIDILTDEIYLDDIRTALQWNDRILAMRQLITEGFGENAERDKVLFNMDNILNTIGKRYVKIQVIAPRVWFNKDEEVGKRNSATEFDPKLIEKAITHGIEIAKDRTLWVKETP